MTVRVQAGGVYSLSKMWPIQLQLAYWHRNFHLSNNLPRYLTGGFAMHWIIGWYGVSLYFYNDHIACEIGCFRSNSSIFEWSTNSNV